MKRIDLTKREQHVLMTVVRMARTSCELPNNVNADPVPNRVWEDQVRRQPGMDGPRPPIPTPSELDSLLERIADNEVTS